MLVVRQVGQVTCEGLAYGATRRVHFTLAALTDVLSIFGDQDGVEESVYECELCRLVSVRCKANQGQVWTRP